MNLFSYMFYALFVVAIVLNSERVKCEVIQEDETPVIKEEQAFSSPETEVGDLGLGEAADLLEDIIAALESDSGKINELESNGIDNESVTDDAKVTKNKDEDKVIEEETEEAGVVVEDGAKEPAGNDTGGALWERALHVTPYDKLYKQGIRHYLDSKWQQCATYLQLAIEDHRWHRQGLLRCRHNCSAQAGAATLFAPSLDASQIFFERTVRNALCLIRCRKDTFKGRSNHVADISVDKDFEIRKPYDYLQLCLFKLQRYADAGNAAVTVLAAQPTHTVMAANLRQYTRDYGVPAHTLTSLELQEYAKLYIAGDKAHQAEEHENTTLHMEAALEAYWKSLQDCRAMCDEPFDQGWFPDFVSSIANHFTFTFRCKRACPTKLSNLYGQEISNFLATIFNYLQYAYHKTGDVAGACRAVGSFLVLLPEDEDMLRNRAFYVDQNLTRCSFEPQQEVVEYVAREKYEKSLLHFIDTEFLFLEDGEPLWTETKTEPPASSPLESIRQTLSSLVTEVFAGQPPKSEL